MRWSLLFLFLLAMPCVLAGALFDSWVYPGQTFERDKIIYTVDQGRDQLLLIAGDRPFILSMNGCSVESRGSCCEEDTERNERYCVVESAREDPVKYEKYIRYEAGEELYGCRLLIETVVPTLKVTRITKPTTPVFDRPTMITVTFKNEGIKPITDILYVEHANPPLTLRAFDGSTANGSFVAKIPTLAAGQERAISYTATLSTFNTTAIAPVITYAYENIKKTMTIGALSFSFSFSAPITVTPSVSPATNAPGEESTYTLTIAGTQDGTSLPVQGTITFADGLTLKSVRNARQDGELLTFDETLSGKTAKTITATLFAPKSGSYTINATLNTHVGDNLVRIARSTSFTVKLVPLVPKLTYSKSTTTLREGETARVRATLENKGTISFKDIRGTVEGTLLRAPVPFTMLSIEPGVERRAADLLLEGVAVNVSTKTELRFNGTYATIQGERLGFDSRLSITLEPLSKQLLLTPTVNTTKGRPGDVVRVAVKVKNLEDQYVFVSVTDLFSVPITPSSGLRAADISLAPKEERQTYLYTIVLPSTDELILVTSTARVRDGPVVESSFAINVTLPPIATVSGSGPGTVNTTAPLTASPPVEKTNFVRRVFDWFRELFS